MRKTIYQCNLCEQQWEEDYVFGVSLDDNGQGDEVILVEAEDSEKHICRGCIIAIKRYEPHNEIPMPHNEMPQ